MLSGIKLKCQGLSQISCRFPLKLDRQDSFQLNIAGPDQHHTLSGWFGGIPVESKMQNHFNNLFVRTNREIVLTACINCWCFLKPVAMLSKYASKEILSDGQSYFMLGSHDQGFDLDLNNLPFLLTNSSQFPLNRSLSYGTNVLRHDNVFKSNLKVDWLKNLLSVRPCQVCFEYSVHWVFQLHWWLDVLFENHHFLCRDLGP